MVSRYHTCGAPRHLFIARRSASHPLDPPQLLAMVFARMLSTTVRRSSTSLTATPIKEALAASKQAF